MKKLLCGLSIFALAMMGSSVFAGNTTSPSSAKSYLHLVADMDGDNGNAGDDSTMGNGSDSSSSDSSASDASDSSSDDSSSSSDME